MFRCIVYPLFGFITDMIVSSLLRYHDSFITDMIVNILPTSYRRSAQECGDLCFVECGDLCCRVRKLLRLFAGHGLVNGDASSELCNCVQ